MTLEKSNRLCWSFNSIAVSFPHLPDSANFGVSNAHTTIRSITVKFRSTSKSSTYWKVASNSENISNKSSPRKNCPQCTTLWSWQDCAGACTWRAPVDWPFVEMKSGVVSFTTRSTKSRDEMRPPNALYVTVRTTETFYSYKQSPTQCSLIGISAVQLHVQIVGQSQKCWGLGLGLGLINSITAYTNKKLFLFEDWV